MSEQTSPPDPSSPTGASPAVPAGQDDGGQGMEASPLQPTDPPRIGDFWLDARLTATAAGTAYLAHGDEGQVMLLTLTRGAAGDAAARERLAGEVNKLHIDTVVARGGQGQDQGRLGHRFRGEDDDPVDPDHAPLAPWVALAYDGSPAAVAEARRILHGVDLSSTTFLGDPSGPDYQLHWLEKNQPGNWRIWPLPWPGRTDRAGWMTILVSWLLMILMAALALLIAVLLFQNKPPAPPPPPLPTTPPPSSSQTPPPSGSPPPSSGSPSSGSPSPSQSSGSPSPSSGSASPSSASPSQSSGSPNGNPSDSPSMESPSPGGSSSGNAGTPTPNKRL